MATTPTVAVSYDAEAEAVTLTVTAGETGMLSVQRRAVDGDWVDAFGPDKTLVWAGDNVLTDWFVPSTGAFEYQVANDDGSTVSAWSEPVAFTVPDLGWWLRDAEVPANGMELLVDAGEVERVTAQDGTPQYALGATVPCLWQSPSYLSAIQLPIVHTNGDGQTSQLRELLGAGRTLFLATDNGTTHWVRVIGGFTEREQNTVDRRRRTFAFQLVPVAAPAGA